MCYLGLAARAPRCSAVYARGKDRAMVLLASVRLLSSVHVTCIMRYASGIVDKAPLGSKAASRAKTPQEVRVRMCSRREEDNRGGQGARDRGGRVMACWRASVCIVMRHAVAAR